MHVHVWAIMCCLHTILILKNTVETCDNETTHRPRMFVTLHAWLRLYGGKERKLLLNILENQMLKEKLLDSSYHCIHWVCMYVYDYASSLSALLIKGIAEMQLLQTLVVTDS